MSFIVDLLKQRSIAHKSAWAQLDALHPFPNGFWAEMALAFATLEAAEAGDRAHRLPWGRRCLGIAVPRDRTPHHTENPKFVRFYRYTASPDEMFFQTIVMNSEWATRVHNSPAYWEWSRAREVNSVRQDTSMLPEECFNLRYIDWGGENTGLRERPAILDQRDWDRLRLSQSHFARKFASGRSAKLLDMMICTC